MTLLVLLEFLGRLMSFVAVVNIGKLYPYVYRCSMCQTENSIAEVELRVHIQKSLLKQRLYFLVSMILSMRILKHQKH